MRVIVVDDHKILRDGIKALLSLEKKFLVIAEAGDGRTAVDLAVKHQPEIIIMDISVPVLNGIEATRQIVSKLPHTSVLALSMHSDRRFILEMFKAGARGYLLKDCAFEELSMALETVAKGQYYLCSQITGIVLKDFLNSTQNEEKSIFGSLSPREREVLQLIGEGKGIKEIASLLFISEKTVDSHRRKIMKKLGVTNIVELLKIAIREGFVIG